ncbi:hypothetical protein [Speluncibacter jeojiensis]|uniref:Ribosomal protein L7/L12 C-terminal domain-containing protein n=1 Tax=Speluncibacter jeojiensis TaxID=2710754 RepID=A0A9X4LYF0_9ACTN|nr:hypothetical protein [Corynebacteriales bacterium D3-21]
MATTWGSRVRRCEPWLAGAMFLGMAVTVGPQAVVGAVDDPGMWNTLYLVMWVVVMVVLGRECVVGLRKRGTAAGSSAPTPAIVLPDDVLAVVESTGGRVAAVKMLREAHPGLGLKATVDLVDDARRDPSDSGPAT